MARVRSIALERVSFVRPFPTAPIEASYLPVRPASQRAHLPMIGGSTVKHYIARVLRRAANRLDPPMKIGEWHNIAVNGHAAGVTALWVNGERIA